MMVAIRKKFGSAAICTAVMIAAAFGGYGYWTSWSAFAEPIAAEGYAAKVADAAEERLNHFVIYDGSYQRLEYPMGDVAPNRGVCTDVIVRAYRGLGVDLQQRVHEDMRRAFSAYPKIWGAKGPDRNIDHRRVPNLERYFTRAGASLPVSKDPNAYQPGDLVSYRLPDGRPHIAIVSRKRGASGAPMIIHNIGWGPQIEDTLFEYKVAGHFRYHPQN